MRSVVLIALLFLAVRPILAEAAEVRLGDHRGFTRIALDVDDGWAARLVQVGDQATVETPETIHLPQPAMKLRNVRRIYLSSSGLCLDLVSGTRITMLRLPGRVVLDVHDASAQPKPGAAAAPARVSDNPTVPGFAPLPGLPAGLVAYAVPGGLAVPRPAPVISAAVDVPGQPVAPERPDGAAQRSSNGVVPASLVQKVDATSGLGLAIPVDATTGAAAYTESGLLHVFFDRPLSVALPEDRHDGPFQGASLFNLENATEITVPVPKGQTPLIFRDGNVWTIAFLEATAASAATSELSFDLTKDGLLARMSRPGTILRLREKVSGEELVVATDRKPEGGVVTPRMSFGRRFKPTLLGLVVERLDDALAIKGASDGFTIADTSPDLGPIAARLNSGRGYTRIMNLAGGSPAALRARVQEAAVAAARLQHGGRGAALLDAAQGALAEAQPHEASALVDLAEREGLGEAQSDVARIVKAAAAILASGPSTATSMPDLGHSDEGMLWRAIEQASVEPSSAATASAVVKQLPLLLDYPEPLKRALAPRVARVLVERGTSGQAALVDKLPQTPSVALYRAQRDLQHQRPAALAVLDRLATSNNLAVAIPAAVLAVQERVRDRTLPPAQAAAHLASLFIPSRAVQMEPELRLTAARYWAQAGDWAKSLKILHDSARQYPTAGSQATAVVEDVLGHVLEAVDQLPTVENVALVQANLASIPASAFTSQMRVRLARAYTRLGLPDDADAVLLEALPTAGDTKARGQIVDTLARDRADAHDLAGADAAVKRVDDNQQDESLTLVRADIAAGEGNRDLALSLLSPLQSTEAVRRRVDLLEAMGHWDKAEAEQRLRLKSIPSGYAPLGPADGEAVLRLARIASHAGDAEMLSGLRRDYLERLKDPQRELLKLLAMGQADTAQPDLHGMDAFAQGMPAALDAYKVP